MGRSEKDLKNVLENVSKSTKCKSKTKGRRRPKVKSKKKEKRKSSRSPSNICKKKKKTEKIKSNSSIPFESMDMIKSPLDDSEYKIIRYPNGLTGCLVARKLSNDSSPQIPTDLDISQPLDPKTFCHPKVQEFNEKFVGLHKNLSHLGCDVDHMSLLQRVVSFPSLLTNSVDKFVDDPCSTIQISWYSQKSRKKTEKGFMEPSSFNSSLPNPNEKDPAQNANEGQFVISICVKSGSMEDPIDYPGMAHLCEHCVFEGTKNFLNSSKILFENSTDVNAVTEWDRTVYYATADTLDNFKKIVAIFADMMTFPLFLEKSIQDEISIIDSESSIRQSFDSIRCHDLLYWLAKDGHPLRHYAAGDDSTLRKPQISAALRQWHHQHYHPSNLIVTLEGPLPLSILMDILMLNFYIPNLKSFSQLKVNTMTTTIQSKTQKDSFPFDLKEINKIYFINPLMDIQVMKLTWLLPSEFWLNFGTKPLNYITLLMSSQGQGSLHYWLMTKGYIVSAKCHTSNLHFYTNTASHAYFSYVLELTELGMKNASQILVTIFSFIRMLQQNGAKRRIFDEHRQISAYKFHFDRYCNPKGDPNVNGQILLAKAIHAVIIQNLAPTFALANSFPLYTRFEPNLINKCLAHLTSDNVNIMLMSRAFAPLTTNVHPNIMTEWTSMDITPELRKELKTVPAFLEFTLPKPNIYLNEQICRPIEYSVGNMTVKEMTWQLYSSGKASVFCHNTNGSGGDNFNFGLPNVGTFTFMITSGLSASAHPRNAVMSELWTELFKMKIKSKFYDALSAGLCFNIFVSDHGLFFYLDGPLQWLSPIWLGIVDEFVNFEQRLDRKLFHNLKTYLEKAFANTTIDPELLAFDLRQFMTQTNFTMMLKLQQILQGVSYEEFLDFICKFKSRMWICCELFGGLTKNQLETVIHSIMNMNYAPVTSCDLCELHTLRLPLGEKCLRVKCVSEKTFNSFIINYYQLGILTFEEKILCQLLTSQLSTFLFHQLRTREGIGYTVWTLYDVTLGVSAIEVWVNTQADKYTTGYVDEKIDEALINFYSTHLSTDLAIKSLFNIELIQDKPDEEEIERQKYKKERDVKSQKGKWDCGSKFTSTEIEDKLSQETILKDSNFPSKIRCFYRKYLPYEQLLVPVTNTPTYRKFSVQIVGNKRNPEASPKEAQFLHTKYLGACQVLYGLNDINGNKGLSKQIADGKVGITLDVPVDVEVDNNYFIIDLIGFKKQLMIYPNLQ